MHRLLLLGAAAAFAPARRGPMGKHKLGAWTEPRTTRGAAAAAPPAPVAAPAAAPLVEVAAVDAGPAYRGVSQGYGGFWRALYSDAAGYPHIIGYYATPKDAALVYDAFVKAHNLDKELNFDEDGEFRPRGPVPCRCVGCEEEFEKEANRAQHEIHCAHWRAEAARLEAWNGVDLNEYAGLHQVPDNYFDGNTVSVGYLDDRGGPEYWTNRIRTGAEAMLTDPFRLQGCLCIGTLAVLFCSPVVRMSLELNYGLTEVADDAYVLVHRPTLEAEVDRELRHKAATGEERLADPRYGNAQLTAKHYVRGGVVNAGGPGVYPDVFVKLPSEVARTRPPPITEANKDDYLIVELRKGAALTHGVLSYTGVVHSDFLGTDVVVTFDATRRFVLPLRRMSEVERAGFRDKLLWFIAALDIVDEKDKQAALVTRGRAVVFSRNHSFGSPTGFIETSMKPLALAMSLRGLLCVHKGCGGELVSGKAVQLVEELTSELHAFEHENMGGHGSLTPEFMEFCYHEAASGAGGAYDVGDVERVKEPSLDELRLGNQNAGFSPRMRERARGFGAALAGLVLTRLTKDCVVWRRNPIPTGLKNQLIKENHHACSRGVAGIKQI